MANTIMNAAGLKQTALKAQDIVVAAKIAIAEDRGALTFARLGAALCMSASEVHAAVQRASSSNLLVREYGELSANKSSLMELLVHGVRYVFPAVFGPVVRGIPTSISTMPLSEYFEQGGLQPIVWPHNEGGVRGMSLCPLYPSVPSAALLDPKLHRVLALIDALRAGAARERELAAKLLPDHFL
jgi:hypothetical protein